MLSSEVAQQCTLPSEANFFPGSVTAASILFVALVGVSHITGRSLPGSCVDAESLFDIRDSDYSGSGYQSSQLNSDRLRFELWYATRREHPSRFRGD